MSRAFFFDCNILMEYNKGCMGNIITKASRMKIGVYDSEDSLALKWNTVARVT